MWLCMNCWPEDELKQVDVCQCEEYHNKNVVRLSWSVFFKSLFIHEKWHVLYSENIPMNRDSSSETTEYPTMNVICRNQSLRSGWGKFSLLVSRKWSQREFTASPAETSREPPSRQAHFVYQLVSKSASRRHLIGLLRCDITGGQLGEESRQPVLRFSGCLRVQPSQAFFQEVILETWERCTLAELQL